MKNKIVIIAIALVVLCAFTAQAQSVVTADLTVRSVAASGKTIDNIYNNLSKNLRSGLNIALIPIYPSPGIEKDTADMITEMLETQFIDSGKYNMVTRALIDKVIREQKFQAQYASNETSIQLGKLLGAHVVIIGNVDGKGANQRIVMRALEVNTGKILTMLMEQVEPERGFSEIYVSVPTSESFGRDVRLQSEYNIRTERIEIQPGQEVIFKVPSGKWQVNSQSFDLTMDSRLFLNITRPRDSILLNELRRETIAADMQNSANRAALARDTALKLANELKGKVQARAGTAFFPLTVNGISVDDGNFLFDVMSIELANSGGMNIIEKQKLLALLDEYDFQMSGMVGVRTIGQLLGADVVIFGIASANAIELVAVDVARFSRLAKVSNTTTAHKTQASQAGQIVLLPVTGAQAAEAVSIADFFTMTMGSNINDQSSNTSLVPSGGRSWGMGQGTRESIINQINQHKAQSAIGISVAPYGSGKIATVRRFDSKGKLNEVLDIQYSDPFEFWIKLQQPKDTTVRRDNGGPVWVNYRPGVNRAEAEELMQMWFGDLISMGSQGLKEIDDQTASFEAGMKGQDQSKLNKLLQDYAKNTTIEKRDYDPWYNIEVGNTDGTIFSSILDNIPASLPKDRPILIFDVSRQGAKTRIEVLRRVHSKDVATVGSFVTEYESAAEFRRLLRVNSLRLMDAMFKHPIEYARRGEAVRSTWITNAALNNLKTNVAVPNTLIQVKRPPTVAGELPGGGFYMARNMVTQREWEATMGSNPSGQKGANLPVYNISLLDAMEYCNRLSLRDGLMPAYDVFYWQGIPKERTQRMTTGGKDAVSYTETIVEYFGQRVTIRTNNYANGYRLPTPDEWDFALTSGSSNREAFIKQLINKKEIERYGWFAANSSGRVQPVGQKQQINGFNDLLGNVMEFVYEGFDLSFQGTVRSGSSFVMFQGKDPIGVRGGDYRSLYDQDYIISAYMSSPALREYLSKDGATALGNKTEMLITAGFRVVRPVFDYWAYRSKETVTVTRESTAGNAAAAPAEDKATLDAYRKRAVELTLEREKKRSELYRRDIINEAVQRFNARRADKNFKESIPVIQSLQDGSFVANIKEPVLRDGKPYGIRELTKIVVKNNTIAFSLTFMSEFTGNSSRVLLIDLDSREVYNPSFSTGSTNGAGSIIFTDVSGSRFSLISIMETPYLYIDEINLDDTLQKAQIAAQPKTKQEKTQEKAQKATQKEAKQNVAIKNGDYYYYFNPRIPLMQNGKPVAYLDYINIYRNKYNLEFYLNFYEKPDGSLSASEIIKMNAAGNPLHEKLFGKNVEYPNLTLKNLDNEISVLSNDPIRVDCADRKDVVGNRFSITYDYAPDAKNKPANWKPMIIEEFDLSKAERRSRQKL